ncbi:MAG TPA: DNA polymerase III subunit alpha [Chitinophagales bacterium]|nr:DNA polymerase III subunit alpha [Chitinophagales bacterium]HMX03284.1 DNA polymerase III subunit alpha [Chitinophagales bacterium]HMZ89859.1 DNA polymerase III subunit alpha [Chitinophagales bacterium]HNE45683.1 DNA polymerase III subunit alpha [Chitinophagales bacterium]HNI53090.1 DNA polymerase III subunit alpha [Chitinophagales bacterium]
MSTFSHLHNHTMFSLLDGASDIGRLYKKAAADGMPALAITDHGNMFGAFQFVAEAYKHKGEDGKVKVKPIVGCEFYLVADRTRKQFSREEKDIRYHQVLLAKNETGYKNLVKMCSLGYMEGMYGKYPRIDKTLIEKYHEGLIATTCCLAAEVPRTILKKGREEGEKVFKWWLDIFGEDYYIELQRHDIPEQETLNNILLELADKYNVKVIATNDAHYVDQQDANAHDILLCINTGEKQATPKMKDFGDDDMIIKGKRFAFYNDQFYFKTQSEMNELFHDVPQALDNTNEIVDKVELLDLKRDILLPAFPIPDAFKIHGDDTTNQWEYLKHLTMEGAHKRYGTMDAETEERINFELFTIKTMGFAGYFLIVMDFIRAGRELGVFVGPGRGSAAGSVVAYCIGITNIDPIKYNLLFERFLNPDRKSMPDIDTDFDDDGRQKVIDYVVDKYGKNQVAQLVTYGTMAAKTSIKDVARVMDLPIADSNALSKLVPERPGISLKRLIQAPISGDGSLSEKENLTPDELNNAKALRAIAEDQKDIRSKIIKEALILEGSVRNTGVHAAGLIIAPKDLTDLLPIAVAKDSALYVTQFEGEVIESAGVIKMDFLGLRTLSIIKTALKLIKENHNVIIDIDTIPLDDLKTFELYQRGETNATFQFESPGMQKYLRELKPDKFEDLIAMNALYRPGPLEYIPTYIKRKHGREPIEYDLPQMEEYLKETYGVTVYQEQVMLLSQKLAGFTKGDADTLRKAMGKKQKDVLDKMKSKFLEGADKNNIDKKVCEKIWTDWEAFAQYAFNKSHSTCYAFVAYQTAYLKAHYPAEYMSAVLTHNQGNIDKVSFFMDECRRMGVPVLPPDVNESDLNFAVNKNGQIRFGMSAIKGVGESAVIELINERKKDGAFNSLFDLTRRVSLRSVNKKTFEALVYAGAFDSFGLNRSQYFELAKNETLNLIEQAIRYGNNFNGDTVKSQNTLFGDSEDVEIAEPKIPDFPEWNTIEKLKKEFEVVGMYMSGHPLDDYKIEADAFKTTTITDIEKFTDKGDIVLVGYVASTDTKVGKTGDKYTIFTLEDFSGHLEMGLFKNNYIKFKNYVDQTGNVLYVKGAYQTDRNDPERKRFWVSDIQLLSEVREKKSMKITLSMSLSDLNSNFLEGLSEVLKQHPGKDSIVLKVIEHTEQFDLLMRNKQGGIRAESAVLNSLGKFGEVNLTVVG